MKLHKWHNDYLTMTGKMYWRQWNTEENNIYSQKTIASILDTCIWIHDSSSLTHLFPEINTHSLLLIKEKLSKFPPRPAHCGLYLCQNAQDVFARTSQVQALHNDEISKIYTLGCDSVHKRLCKWWMLTKRPSPSQEMSSSLRREVTQRTNNSRSRNSPSRVYL